MTKLVLVTTVAIVLSACAAEEPAAVEGGTNLIERVSLGNLVMEDVPAIPSEITARLGQYGNTRSAGFVDWHPSGNGMLVATRFGNVTQLHRVLAPGGARSQLTFFAEPVGGAEYRPGGPCDGLRLCP